MSLDILRLDETPDRTADSLFCFVLLAGSCALASLALACATPFAAFAVIGTAILPFSSALVVVTAAWLVNQAIGFGVLGYPHDIHTLLWGAAIGLAALLATVAAKAGLRAASRAASLVALALALAGAYAAYEIVLFAFTPFLGGAGSFTAAIVARIALLNLVWLIGLVAVFAAWRAFGNARRRYAAH